MAESDGNRFATLDEARAQLAKQLQAEAGGPRLTELARVFSDQREEPSPAL